MRKAAHVIYLVCFLLIMLIPLALTNVEEGFVSDIDNRSLRDAPKWGEAGYKANFELYLRDRIGLRNQMVNGYAVLHDAVANELTHPIYTYGQDGYIFFNMHPKITYSDFHKTFAETVLKIQQYCEARGSKFYFMFEPEKTSVLRRYLPEGVNYDDSWVDELLSYMDQLGINYVDNKELLLEKSYEEDVFNKQYDAGHWNDLGCFYGTNHLLNRMHEDFLAVTELSREQFDITTQTARQLHVSEFKIHDEIPSFQLKTNYQDLSEEYSSEVEVNSNYPYFHYFKNVAEGAEELPKVLFFQGSYYNRGPQFLVSKTREYIGVHNYQNILNLDYYYNLFQPEAVIFEVAEYTFTDAYFDSAKMKNLNFYPAWTDQTSDLTFEKQVELCKENADLFAVDSCISLWKGRKIDRVSVERKFSDARYAYLIADRLVLDLKTDADGFLFADVASGALVEGEDVIVYLEDYDGKKSYVPLKVEVLECFTDELSFSDGVNQFDDTCVMTTEVEDNQFDQVVLQLYDAETGEYLDAIAGNSEPGDVSGFFVHDRESGWYTLRLKANSNKKDEYIECSAYLEHGDVYRYAYQIDQLTQEQVEISRFKIYGS